MLVNTLNLSMHSTNKDAPPRVQYIGGETCSRCWVSSKPISKHVMDILMIYAYFVRMTQHTNRPSGDTFIPIRCVINTFNTQP